MMGSMSVLNAPLQMPIGRRMGMLLISCIAPGRVEISPSFAYRSKIVDFSIISCFNFFEERCL